jgi:hypothetical protein
LVRTAFIIIVFLSVDNVKTEMNLSKGKVSAILAAVFACVSVSEAFTVNAPPAPQTAVVSQLQQPAPASSSLNFPSQNELLQKTSTFSTVNLAAAAPVAAAPTPASASASAAAKPATAVATTTGVSITGLNFDGRVPTTEADEYVVIANGSKAPMDVSGYYVYVATSGTQGTTFTFPKGSAPLKPGASVRVYTNEIHKETGGYSYGSGKAIWNNRGGLAVLKDGKGKKVCEFKYTPGA